MDTLTDAFIKRICDALSACVPFGEPEQIRQLFRDERMLPWLNSLYPELLTSVANLVTFLLDNPLDAPHPLIRFLAVVAAIHPAGSDCRHRLLDLIFELANYWEEDPYPVLWELAPPLMMAVDDSLPESAKGEKETPAMVGPPLPLPPPPMGESTGTEILLPGESIYKKLRLDVAVPDHVVCGEPFQLAATIRELAAPFLAVVGLPQVTSGEAYLVWPENVPVIRLRLQVSSSSCEIARSEEGVQLIPGAPVPVVYFDLIPKVVGSIKIRVVLYQEDIWLGNAEIETNALEEPAGEVSTRVVSLVPTSPTYIEIREVLMQCAPLQSDQDVYHLFSDERLYPWRNLAPDGLNVQERAEALIALLRDKQDPAGRNAIGLLLQVAADLLDEGDACHAILMALAKELLPAA